LHQDIYNKYADASKLDLELGAVSSTLQGDGTYTVALGFTLRKNGAPLVDANGLPSLLQKTFYAVKYDTPTNTFPSNKSMPVNPTSTVGDGAGNYTLTATGFAFDPTTSDAAIFAYVAQDKLDTESAGYSLYDNLDSDAFRPASPATARRT
jgi:hypothetical protein